MYRRRRRRLMIAAAIVGGIGVWMIARVPGSQEMQQQTAESAEKAGRTQRTATARGGHGGQVRAPVLPSEPFARCATKALRGDYGALAEWQRVGYQLGLDQGVTANSLIWATQYFPAEGYHYGETTASGYPCSLRVAAATAIPLFSFVWTEATGIRQVLDTGAKWNDEIAERKGARVGAGAPTYWVDFWVWREGDYGFSTAVIRAAVILRTLTADGIEQDAQQGR